MLEVFSQLCQRDLAEGKQIDFGDLGILDRNSHHKLEFYPNTTINYNEDAFGLKPLAIKPFERKPDFGLQAPIRKTEIRPSTAKVIKLNNAVLRKVAVVLIPLAFLISAVFYLPTLISNKQLNQTSVFSFLDSLKFSVFSNEKSDDANNEILVEEPIETQTEAVVENITDEDSNSIEEETEVDSYPSEFIVQEPNAEVPEGLYHIICGSFVEKDRAEALVDDLKAEGFDAFVAGQSNSGTYRVSMQSFPNFMEASRQIEWIRQKGYDRAWILKKRF